MATQIFGLLDEREEAELHKVRLLNVEEKPFKRVTKRLIAPGAFTNPSSAKLATPPPEGINHGADSQENTNSSSNNSNNNSHTAAAATDMTALKEDITLDFAAFDSAIARLQLLASANAAERRRYADDRVRILETMEGVRRGNGDLRVRLEESRATLARRRGFDELADRITANRMLRPRAEQHANLRKLADECADLERESAAYAGTWRERRAQFDRLVDESKRLLALIRDEKEEVERREGMDEEGSGGPDNDDATPAAGSSSSAAKSGNATPRPDGPHHHHGGGVASRALSEGGATPRPASRGGERTPARPESPNAAAGDDGLKPKPEAAGSFSRASSQQPTPREQQEEGEDVEMVEPGSQPRDRDVPAAGDGTPQITVDAAVGEGTAEKDDNKMDTT